MLKSSAGLMPSELSPIATDEPSTAETIAFGLGIVRRQAFVVFAFALLGAALGGVFFVHATPKYTATATLLVDTHKIELVQQPTVYDETSMQSTGAMESQVELLKSDEVALRVIRKLKLSEDPRFIGGESGSVLQSILHRIAPGYFGESQALSEDQRQSLALNLFAKNLSVERIGVTYAIEIDFESRYPDLAAEVANAVTDAYIDLQRTTEYDAVRRASDWLEERIPELRAKSEDAQKAVVDYKREHNIVETGGGRSIDDQRLTDMNDKLNAAHDETLKARGRFDEFSVAKGTEVPSAAAASESNARATPSDLLDKLRSQYFDIVSKEAESSAKLGPNNPAIISLRNQKIQLRSEMTEEIQRLKDSSESEYAAAQLREAALRKEFDEAVAHNQQTNQAEVRLRELEASAQAYQDLYNTFITRYNASLQQAASPIAEASVITPATPLIKRDYKKTYQMAALFPIGALALGFGVALLRELLGGRVFLTSKSVQSRLGIGCIGLLPKLEKGRRRPRWRTKQPPGPTAPRTLARGEYEVSWTVVDHPRTRFSEGVRSILLAIDLETKSTSSRVFGLTSAMPNEGKSTVTLAVGQLFARNGASVVVVDCDLRNPSLTRSLTPNATSGIIELAEGRASLENVVWSDPSTRMAFIPAILHAGPPDPPSILSSTKMKELFSELRKQYDFVLVDLSPIAPVIDVCATTEFVDAYVLVIEWGRTTVDAVQHALRAALIPFESMLGAVLNKADIKTLKSYDPYLTGYYFQNDRQ
jgi:succinoglycan biosynthesis transport protein ExoP